MRRVALWGALAGVFPGLLIVARLALQGGSVPVLPEMIFLTIIGLVGSVFAAGSLKLAQSGPQLAEPASAAITQR
jgi:hypothetical protein